MLATIRVLYTGKVCWSRLLSPKLYIASISQGTSGYGLGEILNNINFANCVNACMAHLSLGNQALGDRLMHLMVA